MFGDLVSKVYKLCVEAVLSDSYCFKPTCFFPLETFRNDIMKVAIWYASKREIFESAWVCKKTVLVLELDTSRPGLNLYL